MDKKEIKDIIFQKRLMVTGLALILFIIGLLLFFMYTEDRSIGMYIIIIAAIIEAFVIYKYSNINENNVTVINCKCLGKSRFGYRRQYIDYEFCNIENTNETFSISTAQKQKFKKDFCYTICFKNNKKDNILNTANMVFAIPYNTRKGDDQIAEKNE